MGKGRPGKPWRLWPASLRYQVALGAALSFLLFFGLFSYVAIRLIQRSTDAIYAERLKVARVMASWADERMRDSIIHLEKAAGQLALYNGSPERQQQILAELHGIMGGFHTLSLWSSSGKRLLAYPPDEADAEDIRPFALIARASLTGRPEVGLVPVARAHPLAGVIAVPIPEAGGKVGKLLVGSIYFPNGTDSGPMPAGGSSSILTFIDQEGVVLGSSQRVTVGQMDPHYFMLRDLIDSRKEGVRFHDFPGGGHMVTYTPMEVLPGGVLLEEPQDVALAFPIQLRRILVVLGVVAFLAATLGAWVHVRYVVGPISQLEAATRRITSGALGEPITFSRRDELGMLARSFEVMRGQLYRAQEERLRWEREMEERVRQRTQEVHQLLEKIISAQEEERKRLARELHDEAAQALATLLVSVRAFQDTIAPTQARQQLLERALAQGEQALRDIRRIILDLRPSALDDLGFVPALRSYAQDRLGPGGVRLHFEVEGRERRLLPAVETALFRILQEAVNNIAKHARARNAFIRLSFGGKTLTALVEDDGQGFDPGSASRESVGLQGMKERAELIGARLDIQSRTGAGTRVVVELSLGEEKGE